ncbi:HNH endonuclease [Pseudomonas capsici]|uniref:HNH endonuclease n=1 Tax=Pseudomonas capsici TaxID=2810614 RepID=UPI0021F24843|nr:HNH endonuclease [Pseudomonas capsici]MCV4265702.1 HNH endonuclease [Pseudomonas capsici]
MRYWWVNHKQTSRYEIAGGFLWSPMRKVDNSENYFYKTMRRASPGDLVISYSHGLISYIGTVADFAIPAPKPLSFGKVGENWCKNNGWLLPVNWVALESPVRPKLKIKKLREFLPSKYSPISLKTGNGNQGAYLAPIGRSVFEYLIEQRNMPEEAKSLPVGLASSIFNEIDDNIENEILADQSLDSTTKERLVSARIGQGVFRERVYEFESACRLTKVQTPSLLIASHIKPWRLCESAFERLDGANGLLLTPHVDLLFDRGLISFSDNGDVLLSSEIKLSDLELLSLDECCMRGVGVFDSRQKKYLEYHRSFVFLNDNSGFD